MLIGLLLACRDLNLAAKAAGKQLFLTVFLRDDIYSTLQFEDKNKISENLMSVIEWDTPRTKHSLKRLMEKRFDAVLGENSQPIAWDTVFDETREMPSRQSKYDHILDRTFLRPRDIIRFCNTVLAKYKENVKKAPSRLKFDNEDIHAARPEYSDYLHRELDDAIHKHVPDYKNHLELLRSIGAWQFHRKNFDEICVSRQDLVGETLPNNILQALYEFSIIGFYRAGGKGSGGSEYVFRYKDPKAKFDATAQRFRVHAGLIETLGLKKAALAEVPESAHNTEAAGTSKQVPPTPTPMVDVFYSYSHADELLRNELEKHLSQLKRQGLIRQWHDRQIGAGTEWRGAISEHLESANIILLLISSDFLASDYCYDVEMKRALERHDRKEARVIPVILRVCDWKNAPFQKLQALPKDGKPVKQWSDQDEAFTNIAEGIRTAVKDLHALAATK